jgi:hypothetical protein
LDQQPLAGSTFKNWIELLIENRFNVDWQFIPKSMYVSIMIFLTTPLRIIENRTVNKQIKNIKIKDPIFIIGHWRSGTTFLHYLMGQDKNLSYSSTMDTLAPSVFLNFDNFLKKLVVKSLPKKRPMDNLEMNAHLPYEDEYAIANLSPYSFYHGWYFPRAIDQYFKSYVLHDNGDDSIDEKWKDVYSYFLKKLAFKNDGKQIMLKSLVNTAKIKLLLETFPDAKFIHLYRNPYKVYMSTWKLYDSILPIFSFQHINKMEFDKSILKIYKDMYKKYFNEKHLIPKDNLIELKYENFIRKPLKTMKMIYSKFGINGFIEAKPFFVKYIKKHENYKTNHHELDDKTKEKVYREWGFTFKEFGYQK